MEDYAQFTSISTIIRLTNVWIKFLIQIFIECITLKYLQKTILIALNSRIGHKFKFNKFWWFTKDYARQFTSKTISKIIRLKNVDQISDSGFHWVHRGEDQVTDQMVGVKAGERGRKKARVYELISAASFSWVSCFHFVGFRLSVEGDWFSLSSSQNPLRVETKKHGINFKTNPEGEIGHWPLHSSSREICPVKKSLLNCPYYYETTFRFRDQAFPSFKLPSSWSSIILIAPRFNLFLGRSNQTLHIVFDGWTNYWNRHIK